MKSANTHLKLAREAKNYSQSDLAELVGVDPMTVSRWERGIVTPQPHYRDKLAAILGRSAQELGLLDLESPASPVFLADPQIPLALPRLIGRDDLLTSLKTRLIARESVALSASALNGLPGVGKTALATSLVYDSDIRDHFCDGVLWAALGPAANVESIRTRWAGLLGISHKEQEKLSGDVRAWGTAFRSVIGERSLLFVLDDCWRVEDAFALKIGGPNCGYLITTRFPGIAAHLAVETLSVEELSEEDSLNLLRWLAPQAFTLADIEALACALVRAVGGLPLALTLVGNYLRKQAYTGQARRVRSALERLSNTQELFSMQTMIEPAEMHPSLPTHFSLSLQSIIAVTEQLLSEQARAAFSALSILPPKPQSFSEEAAQAVAGCDLDTLDALSDAGLLESRESGRYTLHQLLAEYARLHLPEEQAHSAYARLIDYATSYVEAHKKDYELLDLESTTVAAALDAAATRGKQAELVRLVTDFAPFLILRGLYAQAEQYLQRTHEVATILEDQHSMATLLLYLGRIAQRQGKLARAEASLQEGLTLARQLGDQECICALLSDLGGVFWRRGSYAQAEAYLQEGLMLAQQITDHERTCDLLKFLGLVTVHQGDYPQAASYYEEGLALARRIGDRERICNLLMNLGVVFSEQGNHAQAVTILQEALALARQMGHRELMSALHLNLGAGATEQGYYSQAEAYLQEGLRLARQIGHREWTSLHLLNLAETALTQGHYSQIEGYLQEGLLLAQQIGRPPIIANMLYVYGHLSLSQQQAGAAERAFNEMLTTISQGDQYFKALAHYGLARVAAMQGKREQALLLGETSRTTLEAIGHHKAREVRQWLDSLMSQAP